MFRKKLIHFISFSVFAFSSIAKAESIEISSALYLFDYEEFSIAGKSLDKEQGVLPGVKFKYSREYNGAVLSAFVSLHDGQIDYIGSTQAGAAHDTKTNENLKTIGLNLKVKSKSRERFGTVFGYRVTRWDRDILTKNNILGLHELYSWNELSAGFYFETENKNSSFYTGKISVLKILEPQMKIYLENSSETLDLGGNTGLRLEAGKIWLQGANNINLKFLVEYFAFDRSNTVFTNDFFGSSVYITEPRSESLHMGFELSYQLLF